MARLLLDSQPLIIIPELAVLIGLNEAIIIQQIHYWAELNRKASKNYRDGFYWTYNTYEEWQKQFPFWSVRTITRTIKKLEKDKLVIVGNYNKMKIDRTRWYRINYKELEKQTGQSFGQNVIMDKPECLDGICQNGTSNTRDYPEITQTKTKSNKGIFPSGQNTSLSFPQYLDKYEVDNKGVIKAIYYYLEQYEQYRGKPHPRLKPEQWERVLLSLISANGEFDNYIELMPEDLIPMIDKHFETRYEDCDYNILHFISEGVKKNRFYEVAY